MGLIRRQRLRKEDAREWKNIRGVCVFTVIKNINWYGSVIFIL